MKSVSRKMIRIKQNDYANTPSNKVMKKEDSILKLENELYNPQPNVNHIVLEKIYSGVYEYKNYLIQKVDKTIKYRPFAFDWKIYKNQKYIITVPTLQRARQYFNSIEK